MIEQYLCNVSTNTRKEIIGIKISLQTEFIEIIEFI